MWQPPAAETGDIALLCRAFLAIVLPSAAWMRRRPEDYGLLPDGQRAPDQAASSEASDRAGEELWTLQVAQDGLSTPVVAGGSLYLASRDGTLYALE